MAKFKNAWEKYGLNEAQYLYAWTAGYQSQPDYLTKKRVCHYPRHSAQRRVWQAGVRAQKRGR